MGRCCGGARSGPLLTIRAGPSDLLETGGGVVAGLGVDLRALVAVIGIGLCLIGVGGGENA